LTVPKNSEGFFGIWEIVPKAEVSEMFFAHVSRRDK